MFSEPMNNAHDIIQLTQEDELNDSIAHLDINMKRRVDGTLQLSVDLGKDSS